MGIFDWFVKILGLQEPKDPTELREEVISEAVRKLKKVKNLEIRIQELRNRVTQAKSQKRGTSQAEATISGLWDQKKAIERELLGIQPDLLVLAQKQAGYEMRKSA